jgi:conflict system pore-forming effector with SLATT domain
VVSIAKEAYPALYQAADASSVAGQASYRRLVQTELAFVLGGAFFGVLGAFLRELGPLLPGLSALSLLGAMATKLINRQSGSDQRWFDGRAVAETVKTEAWRYMMRLTPYDDDATADDRLAVDLITAIRARPNLQLTLNVLSDDPHQISDQMRQARALPLDERRRLYIQDRLSDQASWYRRRALSNQVNGRRWFWLSLGGQAAAAAFAFTSIFESTLPLPSLVGLFASVATAATAWTQLGRHDELSKSYALAYQELLMIRTLGEKVSSETGLDRLVTDGENAISREHTMWMAKRATPAAPGSSDAQVAPGANRAET